MTTDAQFNADMAHLRCLGHQILEAVADKPFRPSHPMVEARLIADLSCEALRAISTRGWTFAEMWGAA